MECDGARDNTMSKGGEFWLATTIKADVCSLNADCRIFDFC